MPSKSTEKPHQLLKAQYGAITWDGRRFAICEGVVGRILGPWAVVENNGDGKLPIVHREGISGSRNNAIRVLEQVVNDYAKAEQGRPIT